MDCHPLLPFGTAPFSMPTAAAGADAPVAGARGPPPFFTPASYVHGVLRCPRCSRDEGDDASSPAHAAEGHEATGGESSNEKPHHPNSKGYFFASRFNSLDSHVAGEDGHDDDDVSGGGVFVCPWCLDTHPIGAISDSNADGD